MLFTCNEINVCVCLVLIALVFNFENVGELYLYTIHFQYNIVFLRARNQNVGKVKCFERLQTNQLKSLPFKKVYMTKPTVQLIQIRHLCNLADQRAYTNNHQDIVYCVEKESHSIIYVSLLWLQNQIKH